MFKKKLDLTTASCMAAGRGEQRILMHHQRKVALMISPPPALPPAGFTHMFSYVLIIDPPDPAPSLWQDCKHGAQPSCTPPAP